MNNKNSDTNHDLSNAGNVIGSIYNTSRFDPNYTEKKGMKFFVALVIVLFMGSVIFLQISPHNPFGVITLNNDGGSYYHISWNIFKGYYMKEQKSFSYTDHEVEYRNLFGYQAQLRIFIESKDVDILVAEPEILNDLAEKDFFRDCSFLLDSNTLTKETLLMYDIYENDYDLYYGIPASLDFDLIPLTEKDYIGLVRKNRELSGINLERILKDMTILYN